MQRVSSMYLFRLFAPLVGRVPMAHLWYLWRRLQHEKPHRFGPSIRINTFFPPYPSPAFDRFCRAVIARRRVPFSAYIAITGQCPNRCDHCSLGHRAGGEMSTAAILSLIQQLKAMGACTVGFTGGEPLLRSDLEEFVRAAGPELASIVFTSGSGLDEPRAKELARAGVTCVTVGFEAADPETHDRVRGTAGSFEACRAGVQACRAAGVYVAISTIATREKVQAGELDKLYALGADMGVGEFRVLAPMATGNKVGCGLFMLSEAERRQVAQFHCQSNRRADGPAVIAFPYYESHELFGCGAGYHHVFIDANGQVCPCDLTPCSFGDATREPLADIWSRMDRHFHLPRGTCLMQGVAAQLPAESLPTAPTVSEKLCTAWTREQDLPGCYRHLLARQAREYQGPS